MSPGLLQIMNGFFFFFYYYLIFFLYFLFLSLRF